MIIMNDDDINGLLRMTLKELYLFISDCPHHEPSSKFLNHA